MKFESLKQKRRRIAQYQIGKLLETAKELSLKDPDLAEQTATLAWKIATRHNVRLGNYRLLFFCRKCKRFILPLLQHSRYRFSKKRKSINITCLYCGNTYRKIIPKTKIG